MCFGPRLVLGGAGVGLLVLGVVLGAWLFSGYDWSRCEERYAYVSRTLACGERPVIDKGAYLTLRTRLVSEIEDWRKRGAVRDVAIFFRDLRSGPTFGIDELMGFAPASLLKLPLMFAYLSAEEAFPGFIQRKVSYDGELWAPAQQIPPAVTIQAGRDYEIDTLLANMLVYSDNLSYLILRQYLRELPDGEAHLVQTYQELGILTPQDLLDKTVSVHGYASLFRLLYTGGYLSAELSEKALTWLAHSAFKGALVAGVPEGIEVAHKFGEREHDGEGDAGALAEFHDCGVVYFPENPYILCVMTRGRELSTLIGTVKQISSMVYGEVESRRRSAGAHTPPRVGQPR